MAKRRTLKLTEEQRKELEHLRDHDPRPYVRERCAALLKIADGKAPHWVARVIPMQFCLPSYSSACF